jgi:hypothetical protein
LKNKRYRFFAWLDKKTEYALKNNTVFHGWQSTCLRPNENIDCPLESYGLLDQTELLLLGLIWCLLTAAEKVGNELSKHKPFTVRANP